MNLKTGSILSIDFCTTQQYEGLNCWVRGFLAGISKVTDDAIWIQPSGIEYLEGFDVSIEITEEPDVISATVYKTHKVENAIGVIGMVTDVSCWMELLVNHKLN